jgi:Glycosyl hydrolases family 43
VRLVATLSALAVIGCQSSDEATAGGSAPTDATPVQMQASDSAVEESHPDRYQQDDANASAPPDSSYQDAVAVVADVVATDAPHRIAKIKPGLLWTDDQGKPIHAHGGNAIKVGDRWYWYGENVRDTSANLQFGSFNGINCYSSSDFESWHFEGTVLGVRPSGSLSKGQVAYRPKVLYDASTKKYVMVLTECCPTAGHLVFAQADSPAGPFSYVATQNGVSNAVVMDMGVFQEDNGAAYVVYSANNAGVGIDTLAGDYLSAVASTAKFTNNGACEEGPGIVKTGGRYFLINSRCSGWAPNQNHYRSATSLAGPWKLTPDGNLGDTTTYNSQSGFILTVQGTKGSTYIYMGDRWDCAKDNCDLSMSKYVWLPLSINGTTMTLDWYDTWYLDLDTGTWSAQP